MYEFLSISTLPASVPRWSRGDAFRYDRRKERNRNERNELKTLETNVSHSAFCKQKKNKKITYHHIRIDCFFVDVTMWIPYTRQFVQSIVAHSLPIPRWKFTCIVRSLRHSLCVKSACWSERLAVLRRRDKYRMRARECTPSEFNFFNHGFSAWTIIVTMRRAYAMLFSMSASLCVRMWGLVKFHTCPARVPRVHCGTRSVHRRHARTGHARLGTP